MFIKNTIILLFEMTGIELTKLQKILMIILCFEFAIVGLIALYRMVGCTFLWYKVEAWMVLSEAICSALALPQVAMGIWEA